MWITTYGWRSPEQELQLLDADGVWIRRVTMPAGSTVLDAGPDWVLLGQRGELDVPIVAVYQLVESGGRNHGPSTPTGITATPSGRWYP